MSNCRQPVDYRVRARASFDLLETLARWSVEVRRYVSRVNCPRRRQSGDGRIVVAQIVARSQMPPHARPCRRTNCNNGIGTTPRCPLWIGVGPRLAVILEGTAW